MGFKKVIGLTAAAAVCALVLSGCSGTNDAKSEGAGSNESATKTVKIGTVGASDPHWQKFIDAAKKEGIEVKLVDFSDYNQPNPALSAGEIDLNQFQHNAYLAAYNESANDTLVPIGSTAIFPLSLYSTKYKSVAEIPAGGEIAIPNDESNRARALLVLQQAKLLKLKNGGSIFSNLDDILKEESKVKVREIDATLTASSLNDLAGAVINNDFVAKAGLKFDDALFGDDPSDPSALPYVNHFTARAQDADNPTYKKLVEIYQNSKEVQEELLKASDGSAVTLKVPASELRESLKKVQQDIRNKKS
ncbi:methionine ABC transporter substrate-binding protein [Canibacter sp. lx-45]|uniref:MetQ/NlpA family ABC transporter substrate-binding protein n=1 Tax=Canibacter zhuwentaonis TaxID=2837491 RepID=UPI001BDC3D00|nr:MetQ/NlpA family ABC transporter substrate-binding protein [Canibacter zhuwentaonis]MBT1035108.1 methionine ABC transporter substrate-binding protein [Canibacter zhuwentaonis]